MPMRWILMVSVILMAQFAAADGVNDGLTDPVVIPTMNGSTGAVDPGMRTPQPMGVSGKSGKTSICTNGESPRTPPEVGGYEVRFACDHIIVGLALLAGLYFLGSSSDGAAAN